MVILAFNKMIHIVKYFLKYLTKFRLLLYISCILCTILLSTNPYWYNNVNSDKSKSNTAYDENFTIEDYNIKDFATDEVRISEIYPNCGLRHLCPEYSFPVHVYTGEDKDDQPKLCILGKYVGGSGRGLNIAVIEPKYLQILTFQSFDLYSHNSTYLEAWLNNYLRKNDIVIAFTFDEASKELSKRAKSLLYKLGSGKIQDLQYRSQWYMISQKGLDGFTPLEKISYARNDKWGEVINERICVPRKIEALKISPDPFPRANPSREQLCTLSKRLRCEKFCGPLARHEPIVPSLLTNRSLIGNPAFSTPIIVIAGYSISTLALTLETLIYQPGIHPVNVFVLQEEDQQETYNLTKIFGFKPLIINSTIIPSPNYKIFYGLNYINEYFSKKKFAIILEEGLLLSPDYLFYLAQTVPILEKDDSLLGISGWNPYGYRGFSAFTTSAFRVEDFPGLGFLIKMEVFIKSIKDNVDCCQDETYRGWPSVLKDYKDGHIIIPEVSRVLMRPIDIAHSPKDRYNIFTIPRHTNTNLNAWIDHPHGLVKERYFQQMASVIESSITVHLTNDDITLCANSGNIAMKIMVTELKNKTFAVYYEENDWINYTELKSYLKCFNLYISQNFRPQTLYHKTFRLTKELNSVILIESTSPFAKHKKKTLNN